MSQMTLRQIPEAVENAIRHLAECSGKSMNRTVIDLLQKSLGIEEKVDKKRDLSQFAGTWTEEEAEEFNRNTEVFNDIDEEVWK